MLSFYFDLFHLLNKTSFENIGYLRPQLLLMMKIIINKLISWQQWYVSVVQVPGGNEVKVMKLECRRLTADLPGSVLYLGLDQQLPLVNDVHLHLHDATLPCVHLLLQPTQLLADIATFRQETNLQPCNNSPGKGAKGC